MFFEVRGNSYVNYWNSFQYVRQHRQGTQTYQIITNFFDALEKGKVRRTIATDAYFQWCDKWKIDGRALFEVWTTKQIKHGINNLALLFDPNYLPKSKDKLSKSLADLLYSSYNQNSMFLWAYYNTPKPLIANDRPLVEEVHFDNVMRVLTENGVHSWSLDDIWKLYSKITEDYNRIKEQLDFSMYPTQKRFFDEFINYLSTSKLLFPNLSIYALYPNKKYYNRFIQDMT
jgi:hypothetical protein